MADLLTEITELVTGLGMTGIDSLTVALSLRPPAMRNVSDEHWDRLNAAFLGGNHSAAFAAAWANGRAFLESPDGLRGRLPLIIEWKGSHQAPGFDFVPVDLRVDHVYLVSCKYDSKIELLSLEPLFAPTCGSNGRRSHHFVVRVLRPRRVPAFLFVRTTTRRPASTTGDS